MKYLISFILLSGLAHALPPEYPEEMEVGSAKDCVIVGKTDDTSMEDDLTQVQHRVMDCLSPDTNENEAKSETKHPEVVSESM